MSSQEHLRILNPTYEAEHNDFPQFPNLPEELRVLIWEHSLPRNRIVKVEVPSGWITKDEICLARGHHILSKLLRVNRESRQAVLRFYRIHIPCTLKKGQQRKYGILPFNPEFDILQIRVPPRRSLYFSNFICKLKSLDPHGVGVTKLGLDAVDMICIKNCTDVTNMGEQRRNDFTATIAQLDKVFFIDIDNFGRVCGSEVSDIVDKVEFHRSIPIAPKTPAFDIMASDPRPIQGDLKHVYFKRDDPRRMMFNWREMLHLWEIPHSSMTTSYHFLMASRGCSETMFPKEPIHKVMDRADAERWLRAEDRFWEKLVKNLSFIDEFKARVEEIRSDEELAKASSISNAVGYWMFPMDALGSLKESEFLSPIRQGP
ncbi:uncharacterized protein F4822DRAFT_432001 [Hypoxylon trugodes]|uniref:uncharacterized protein n=1 Tax=Hypoxylon trugodes TaxID=326681 RepID=UPI002199AE3A|nr:uncharacterized protein F4822DRAFT_432001 [Hypoxylon trugodes]KAI1385150.1 hypothetical protein F4822DRAFT_432001 [Hypoxylon trugodes]